MKKYTTALALLMLFGIGGLQAQALTTKVCKGETVCHTIGGHRGFVQWEQSADGNSWFLVPFMSADTFCMTADSNGYYRAAVQEGTCAPVYTEVRYVQAITVTADAGADGSVCANSGSLIGGSPTASGGVNPYSYSWTPGTGLNSTTDANPTASPALTTTYVVTVTDSIGCVGTDSVTVTPSAAVVADAGPDLALCFGSSATLGGSPSGSGGTGALTYLWSPATDLSSTTVANPTVTPTSSNTYMLTVTDSLGCFAMDTAMVDTNSQLIHDSTTFVYTGSAQMFVVPGCVDSITMDVYGAQGGANWINNTNFGGRVRAKIAVTPGETLMVYVGQQPTTGTVAGWNGGGAGDGAGKGGGGASDVRRGGTTLNDRIIVGGAGGGAGYWSSLHVVGGVGGGLTGGNGYRDPSFSANPGGLGAGQSAGGANGTCASFNNVLMAGSFGQGGTPLSFNCGCEGYGGGGGWYGGAGSGNCRGAGGGSSYTIPTATNVQHFQGVRVGNGQVKLVW
ncbi:MAG: hypothetical protein IPN95_22130 [Bacteroidetes bacterium]|nr:hypothetical protein [Bacteroidota bacterium]